VKAIAKSFLIAAATALITNAGDAAHKPAPAGHLEIPPDLCPLSGLNKDQKTSPSALTQKLNEKKNRRTAPTDTDFDSRVTIQKMLAPGKDIGRFDEARGAEITGLVIKVEQGGHPETANCGDLTEQFTDTHITVAVRKTNDLTTTLIVEVTPWWRQTMAQRGMDWSTVKLKQTLTGHTVKFRGWLMFDLDHESESINTRPANAAKPPWRQTAWEIHPITAIEVVQ